jgi:uncharacterized membrane protein HdeD (DUF308 family)
VILQQELGRVDRRAEELLRAGNRWKWFFGFGAALVAIGAFAITASFLTTLTTVAVFGVLLLAGAGVELVSALVSGPNRGAVVHMAVGLIHLVVGALILEHPVRAAEGLTLMLAAAFLIGGLIRVGYALSQPFEGRGRALVTGVVAAAFGISIWQQWPESGLWAIGLCIGIDIALIGWSWVMLGLALKRLQAAGGPEHRASAHLVEAK